ncbi:heme-thiolate peroxidase [Phlebiopsis gigantea 11061_1 CR5-6]|uniref:Heme-thiolate peroxidase n=1 Tax=Phlebiopsis gigantea (strain 11061_1 CR5-6) TaxID=745531 RepID=A0A0C3RWQ1_PHLG1|nr:heme-thiolate peroxidase [Phlebiopsis gigantea 11061_1 CR5-6]
MSVSTSSLAKCPVTGAIGANPHEHDFIPAKPTDSRAPCPAMNTMANHGYLPRDGQGITAKMTVDALIACYKLSRPLAWVLTHGALALLEQGGPSFCLQDLARHNHIEHDASLYHEDAGPRDEYAPIHGNPQLLELVWKDSADGVVMTPEDVARVRVRREAAAPAPLDFIHRELAKGEMAIVLNMFNNPSPALHADAGVPLQPRNVLSRGIRRLLGRKDTPAAHQLDGVPIARMREWFEHERLPEGWAPYHKTTLREAIVTNNRMRFAMRRMRKAQKNAPAPAAVEPVQEKAAESRPEEKKVEAAEEEEGMHTVAVRAHGHPDRSANSSASSSFPESVLHTPSSSEFAPAFDPKLGGVALPRIDDEKWRIDEFEVRPGVVVQA